MHATVQASLAAESQLCLFRESAKAAAPVAYATTVIQIVSLVKISPLLICSARLSSS
jgi:hypothetical protein